MHCTTQSGTTNLLLRAVLTLAALCVVPPVFGAEGGEDFYQPGGYGTFGMASLGEAGLSIENVALYAPVQADLVVRQGMIRQDSEQVELLNTFELGYTSNAKVLGGRYIAGIAVPLGRTEVEATVFDRAVPALERATASASGLGDITVVPLGIGWQTKSLSILAYLQINVPIGEFDADSPVSLSLNYWAFDSNVSLTWADSESGLELDLNLGLVINTTNSATDYHSGDALHLDVALGYQLSEAWAVGLGGYAYDQVSGDSGSGAILGPFEGRAYGLAPVVSYSFGRHPRFGLTAKWVHDLAATNRLEGDYGYVTLGFSL